ncbi:MAG: 3-dehydroquinate synthase [Muribaculaceae bacterium]|nr:3-dehydroquinate synthase [Muribaculaceae bacterium]
MQRILFDNDTRRAIVSLVDEMRPQSVHVVTDEKVETLILPGLSLPEQWRVISLPEGEESKSLAGASAVWESLIKGGATRHSLVINIGGGVITDLGGFAAATYKRGIRFINLPTTLLAAVDAAVGGKTGVNFGGLKNEIGVFREADAVVVSATPLAMLDRREFLSGYAEMLKHAFLMGSEALNEFMGSYPTDIEPDVMLGMLERNVRFKQRVVTEDPTEKGLRRTLNFGHTAGHAFESFAIERGNPVTHGHAVARGMVVELILSHLLKGLPTSWLNRYVGYLRDVGYRFGTITCDDYPRLLEFMSHDKKNIAPGAVNFTLLRAPGRPEIDCTVNEEDIRTALDISRDMLE